MKRIILATVCLLGLSLVLRPTPVHAQELQAKITINHNQVQGTDASIFENLQQTLEQFVNEKQWTNLQFQRNERIVCNFNITVKKYDQSSNLFTCSALIQANRPVYGASYSSTLFNTQDNDFNFEFAQFDQIEFNEETVDNQLTALMAYYAYLIIGMDMDTMAPLGGSDILQMAMDVANNSQNLGYAGWKAFENDRNRFAIINDYLDGAMEPLRQLEYKYHRQGLDRMTENTDTARMAITESIEMLKQARDQKSMSALPVIFTDIKRDELVSIYSGKGTAEEREKVYNIVFAINASQSNYWEKLRK